VFVAFPNLVSWCSGALTQTPIFWLGQYRNELNTLFQDLKNAIPESWTEVNRGDTLGKAVVYIRKLEDERDMLRKEIDVLRKKIDGLPRM
jgi:hypothetical protein